MLKRSMSKFKILLSPSKGSRGVLLLLCVLLAACASKKHAVSTSTTVPDQTTATTSAPTDGKQSKDSKLQDEMCVTARLRLDLSTGGNNASVGGTLRMKRNDVIQLSIVTFGVLEVARIEMTPDYFMLIDKVGKQYVKSPYNEVSFLRDGNVDFYYLQAYFWDEQTSNYSGWVRKDFVSVGGKSLPTKHSITIPTSKKTIKADLTLSNLTTDSEWEKRTQVSSRYKEVSVDELISRIMSLSL